jgi:hypothetical protein
MARLIDWGVDGLITDYPDRARAVMAAKGLPLPPPVGEISRPILPERVRRFGFIPDLDALSPGDLILFRDRSSTLVGRAIAAV